MDRSTVNNKETDNQKLDYIERTKSTNARRINGMIKMLSDNKIDKGQISDGYHTFDELYEHRIELFISMCQLHLITERLHHLYTGKKWDSLNVWRSRLHSDGSKIDGWFVLGMYTEPGEQITYHLPNKYWDRCNLASSDDPYEEPVKRIATLERAPEFDGHTSQDVLERLRAL